MIDRLRPLLDMLIARRELARWTRAADRAAVLEFSVLRRLRGRARGLRQELDRFLHVAETRLALPALGARTFFVPHDADWSWRPELWAGPVGDPGLASVETRSQLGCELTVFHDCSLAEMTLRQIRNLRDQDLAPYGVKLDVFAFDGSFLSLVLDLPPEAVAGLSTRHLLRMDTLIEVETPLEIFARLNIKHGPNTEQVIRELPPGEKETVVEFDLGYSRLNEKRIEKAWIDIIFEGPEMNQVVLRDLTFSRSPRADI